MLSMGVAPRTQDAHGLVAGPERPAWRGVPVMQGELRLVQGGFDPGLEVVAVGHEVSMLSSTFPRPDAPDNPRSAQRADRAGTQATRPSLCSHSVSVLPPQVPEPVVEVRASPLPSSRSAPPLPPAKRG